MAFLKRYIKGVVFIVILVLAFSGGLWAVEIIYNPEEIDARSVLSRTVSKAEFLTRSGICRALAPIRLGFRRKPLISARQIAWMKRQLKPGDIILARDDLKLSALFIPGFWTHAALYLGSRDEFNDYFADLPVPYTGLTDGEMEKALQGVWQKAGGESGAIIEAVIDGVGTYPLSHLSPVDYLAVLRPLLPKKSKRRALFNALGLNGAAYDFNFDFDSKNALICSELVYHAYRPSEGHPGLRFPLYRYNGRRFMSVNDIAKKYSVEYGSAAQQLACILFIDGGVAQEHTGIDLPSIFRDTWNRTPMGPFAGRTGVCDNRTLNVPADPACQ
jgi:hypothetical protein